MSHSCSFPLGAAAEDIYEFVPTIMRELIYRLNDESSEVLKAGQKAWTALSKHVPAEESAKHIEFMRNLINSMVSEARRRKGGVGDGEFFLPGFNIPKGTTRYAAFDDGFQSKMRTNVFNISPTQKLWGLL